MAHLLQIDSSALAIPHSHSKTLAKEAAEHWNKRFQGEHTHLDLAENPPPHINASFIEAMYTPSEQRTEAQKKHLELSDLFIAQLKSASHLIIDTPMYNFSIPSTLKAYLDHIVRVGETFLYTEHGPEGLLPNIEHVTLIVASGGDYSTPPMSEMNFVDPYLKTVLAFIGMDNIAVIHAPQMGMGDQAVEASMKAARKNIRQLFN